MANRLEGGSRLRAKVSMDGGGGMMAQEGSTDALGRAMYALVCSSDGVTARKMARELGVERRAVNRRLYSEPFVSDLCYHDGGHRWLGLVRQHIPHEGLREFSGWYGYACEFMSQGEAE